MWARTPPIQVPTRNRACNPPYARYQHTFGKVAAPHPRVEHWQQAHQPPAIQVHGVKGGSKAKEVVVLSEPSCMTTPTQRSLASKHGRL